jgi:hypothetical protein
MDETCFVIQPFDQGKYDELYRDLFAPAIKDAGLKPYRVDSDPSVTVLIDKIESEIRSAAVCFAEITEDNPNVWYELGFAISANKPVVMVCSEERTRFPFDVSHRRIIRYSPRSPSQFQKLKEEITKTLRSLERSEQVIQQIEEAGVLVDKEGLSTHERIVIITIASDFSEASPGLSDHTIRSRCNRTGMTDLAVVLALRKLKQKSFIEPQLEEDSFGNAYTTLALTDKAWDWMLANEKDFILERKPPPPPKRKTPKDPDLDAEPDDIPF